MESANRPHGHTQTAAQLFADHLGSLGEQLSFPCHVPYLRFHTHTHTHIYVYIYIYYMFASRASWCCSCARCDGHTLPKRALPMHRPDCLAGSCADISCTARGYPAFVVKTDGLSVWIWGGYARWTAGHCTIVPPQQQSGGSHVLTTAKVDRLAANRLRKKRHRAEESIEKFAVRLQSLCSYYVWHRLSDPTSVYLNT